MEWKERQPFTLCLHQATQVPEQLVTRGSCQIYWHFFLSKRLENSNKDITASSCQSFYFPRYLNQTLEWLLLFLVSLFKNCIDAAALWDSRAIAESGETGGKFKCPFYLAGDGVQPTVTNACNNYNNAYYSPPVLQQMICLFSKTKIMVK